MNEHTRISKLKILAMILIVQNGLVDTFHHLTKPILVQCPSAIAKHNNIHTRIQITENIISESNPTP